jgi:hypothetical protein
MNALWEWVLMLALFAAALWLWNLALDIRKLRRERDYWKKRFLDEHYGRTK